MEKKTAKTASKESTKKNPEKKSSSNALGIFLGISIGLVIGAVVLAQDDNRPFNHLMDSITELYQSTRELGSMERFVPKHAQGVEVADFSTSGLNKVRVDHRVIDLINGLHWDDLLQDMPDEMRPPSAVWFYDPTDKECFRRYENLRWDEVAERQMPSRERLMAARYDMHAGPVRAWYKFTPEMDLKKRFKVKSCPELVFVPRKCNGETEWCSRGPDPTDEAIEIMGCENFKDQCTDFESWDGKGNWVQWILDRIAKEGEPKIPPFLGSYAAVKRWTLARDHTTTDNHLRNIYLSQSFPAFTNRGFKAMPIPKPFYDWLLTFYHSYKNNRATEFWDASSTQVSFHEKPTSIVNLDQVYSEKIHYANAFLKPIIEEWSGMPNLELTSFYGIREYPLGSTLKNHVDRIDTHVLSVTMSVFKFDHAENPKPWNLDAVQWSGDHVRYKHPPGTMVLYESSKLIHGRIERNREGIHVGCFLHYRPSNMMKGKGSDMWSEIVHDARMYQRMNTATAKYHGVDSVEPTNPQYTTVNYGEGSALADYERNDESFSVGFVNQYDTKVEVFWISPEGDKVPQFKLAVNERQSLYTFVGHKFAVSYAGIDETIEEVTIVRNQKMVLLRKKPKK